MYNISIDKLQNIYIQSLANQNPTIPLANHGLIPIQDLRNYIMSPLIAQTINSIPKSALLCLNTVKPEEELLLLETAWYYALKIKTDTDFSFLCQHKKPKRENYPPCINVCVSKNRTDMLALEQSSYVYSNKFHAILDNAFFTKFSKTVGQKPDNIPNCTNTICKGYEKNKKGEKCRNTIGNCAEQRAANDIFKSPICSTNDIADLIFSITIRPRTMEIIPFCCNCKSIFPQLA